MTQNETVSVVIPTYYRNDSLREAIESVQDQSHGAIETIVVDGSDDARGEAVADAYGVRYIHQGEDGGAHEARSMGAEAANGSYVNFLDDDDRMDRRKIEKQRELLQSDSSTGVVYCGIEWESGHQVLPDPNVQGDVLEHALMFHMTPSSPSTMLIERSVLDQILPFQNRHGADDMGMKIELAQRCEFEYVDEPLVYKGSSEDSLGGSQQNIAGRFELLDRYDHLYDRFPTYVRQTALSHTYLLSAQLELDEHVWSPRAIARAALATYHVPGFPISFVGFFCASLLGQPGRDVAGRVYSRMFLGDEHRGKLTTPNGSSELGGVDE